MSTCRSGFRGELALGLGLGLGLGAFYLWSLALAVTLLGRRES